MMDLIFSLLFESLVSSGFLSLSFWDYFKSPHEISTNAHLISSLFEYTTALNIFYFFLVCAALFGFSWLYHHKRHPKPYYTYGYKPLHLKVTLVVGLAVFFSIDFNITRISNNDLMAAFWNWPDEKNEEVVRVQVLAKQWMWSFRHAGEDNEFNTVDDIVTQNEMYIPSGKKVVFHITSKDVIHSFYVPNTKQKVDAIPGRITRMWFEVEEGKEGTFDIACAEMCGTNHYLMAAKMFVQSQEDFSHWLVQAHQIALTTNDIDNPEDFWGWKWESTK